MSRKPIGTISGIQKQLKEQCSSKHSTNDNYTANSTNRSAHAQANTIPKSVPHLKPIRNKQTAKLPPLKDVPVLESGGKLPDIGQVLGKPSKCTQRSEFIKTPEIYSPSFAHIESPAKRSEIHEPESSPSAGNHDDTDVGSINTPLVQIKQQRSSDLRHQLSSRNSYNLQHGNRLDATPSIKWIKNEPRPAWFEEREKLRQHRKKAERTKPLSKPVKATRVFQGKDNRSDEDLTNNFGHKNNYAEQDSDRNVRSQRIKVSTSRHRDVTDDKDIRLSEEVEVNIQAETKQRRNRYTPSGSFDTLRADSSASRMSRGTECSKRGVGFRSKSRLAAIKAEEEERVKRERKERERIEMMIPKKIRKDFKKYGFI